MFPLSRAHTRTVVERRAHTRKLGVHINFSLKNLFGTLFIHVILNIAGKMLHTGNFVLIYTLRNYKLDKLKDLCCLHSVRHPLV